MIILFIIAGLILISSGIKGTEHALFNQLAADMTGQDGFIVWAAAFLVIGAVGYIPGLRKITFYMMLLIIVVIVLRNGGIFSQLQSAIQTVVNSSPATSPLEQDQPLAGSGNAGASANSPATTDPLGGILGGLGSVLGGFL